MPGNEVKDWATYEALRREGKSKESAARIANWQAGRRRNRRVRVRMRRTRKQG